MSNKPLIDLVGKVKYKGTQKQIDEHPKGHKAYFVSSYADKDSLNDLFAYCEKFAFITHDRDVHEDGSPKSVHCHFIVRYKDSVTPTAFAKRIYRLAPDEQTVISPLGDKYCAIDYMLHRDKVSVSQGKTLYNESEILTDDMTYFFRAQKAEDNRKKNEAFFADLFDDSITTREMALRYGRDYAKNIHRYQTFVHSVKREENLLRRQAEFSVEKEDIVDISFEVIKHVLSFYLPHKQMPENDFLERQIYVALENKMLTPTYERTFYPENKD